MLNPTFPTTFVQNHFSVENNDKIGAILELDENEETESEMDFPLPLPEDEPAEIDTDNSDNDGNVDGYNGCDDFDPGNLID